MSMDDQPGFREHLTNFIEAYRNEPCLWQTSCKEYHNRSKKNAAYDKLIKKYKPIDPSATKETVVKKINNIRTTVRREINKIKESQKSGAETDDVYTPKLWYFPLLNFLGDQETPRPSRSNIYENENEEEPTESSSWAEETDLTNPQSPLQTSNNELLLDERRTPTHQRSRATKPTKECGTLADDVLRTVNDHVKRPRIDDRFDVYGKHIAMKLRELQTEQRILAENIINNTLFLAEIGTLTRSHSVQRTDYHNTTFSYEPQIQTPFQSQMQYHFRDTQAATIPSHTVTYFQAQSTPTRRQPKNVGSTQYEAQPTRTPFQPQSPENSASSFISTFTDE